MTRKVTDVLFPQNNNLAGSMCHVPSKAIRHWLQMKGNVYPVS